MNDIIDPTSIRRSQDKSLPYRQISALLAYRSQTDAEAKVVAAATREVMPALLRVPLRY